MLAKSLDGEVPSLPRLQRFFQRVGHGYTAASLAGASSGSCGTSLQRNDETTRTGTPRWLPVEKNPTGASKMPSAMDGILLEFRSAFLTLCLCWRETPCPRIEEIRYLLGC